MERDEYGNSPDDDEQLNCSYPDCGCDENRLCMAKNGPSGIAFTFNRPKRNYPWDERSRSYSGR